MLRLKKRAYHHGDLKAALVEAALRLIARHGPRGFSLSQAAAAAGVTVGAPYKHFADKEALFIYIAAQGFEELCKRLETARSEGSGGPADRLVGLALAYVRFAQENPAHFQVMFDSTLHRRNDLALSVPAGGAFRILTDAVKEFAAQSRVPNEETLTAALWAMMHGHAALALEDPFANMGFKTSQRKLVEGSFQLFFGK